MIVVLVQQKGTVNLIGDATIFISSNKVLTFGSSFEYESGRHSTCFAMNSDRFVECWHVGFFPKIIDPLRNPTALRARSSGVLAEVSSLRLVFLLSSDDPGRWDPRDPVAVEPLLCPSIFQDLA